MPIVSKTSDVNMMDQTNGENGRSRFEENIINNKVINEEEADNDEDDNEQCKNNEGRKTDDALSCVEHGLEDKELEDYKIWKKNCCFLYDLMVSNVLEWPSLTVQWLPQVNQINYQEYTQQKLVIGTQVSKGHQNYLLIAKHTLPVVNRTQAVMSAAKGCVSMNKTAKLENHIKIFHEGDVNRARYMPQNTFLIGTMSSTGKAFIFDYSKHPSEPQNGQSKPELILDGHKSDGYGISWNNQKSGILTTSGQDESICLWDINNKPTDGNILKPIQQFKGHTGSVNDVKWHCYHQNYFASVGDDKMFNLWDDRLSDKQNPVYMVQAHEQIVNALSFNPFSEFVLITASDDRTIGLFDLRNLKHRLHSFVSHSDDVLDVSWSPHYETVFASSGRDKRLMIWDMTKIGESQSETDALDGPPEMIFIHGGHTGVVNDFNWNPTDQWSISSVAANNILHTFKPFISVDSYNSDQ